jgi:hypothetical protein
MPTQTHSVTSAVDPHAQAHAERVLAELLRRPGATAAELTESLAQRDAGFGLDPDDRLDAVEVRRRLCDLKNGRKAYRGPQRECGIANRKVYTWWAAQAEPRTP